MFQEDLYKDTKLSPEFMMAEMDTQYSLKDLFINIGLLLLFLMTKLVFYCLTKIN